MERERSRLETSRCSLLALLRLKIRPGRRGHLVRRRDARLSQESREDSTVLSESCVFSAEGKSTLSLVSFANYKWFEEWKDDKVNNRGAEYKELKQAFIDTCLDIVMDIFPKITPDKVTPDFFHGQATPDEKPQESPSVGADGETVCRSSISLISYSKAFIARVCPSVQIEYVDAGTPITNTHYIGTPKGEIYGADHGKGRFSPELNAMLRPQTPLKNLYLTGEPTCRVCVILTSPLV